MTAPSLLQSLNPDQWQEAVFSLRGAVFAYSQERPVLTGLDFALFPGQSLGLWAPNGSGKTTLFRVITGLERLRKGEVRHRGKVAQKEADFCALRREVGFVLQEAEDQLFFPNVLEDVVFGPLNLGLAESEAKERAAWALDLMGIGDLRERLSHTLSGGQKKMVALAAMLAMRPAALLLDEPANGLDADARARLVAALAAFPCARIIIAHDRALLDALCPEIMTLREGKLAPL